MEEQAFANELDLDVRRVVAFKALQLAGSYGFSRDEASDIAQDLALDYLKRRARYDRSRSAPGTFLRTVVGNRSATLAKRQSAQCRDYRRTVSIRHDVGGPSAQRASATTCRNLREVRQNFRLDVIAAVKRLPPQLRRICELLIVLESASEVAETLAISRATLYRRLIEIRDLFSEMGVKGQNV